MYVQCHEKKVLSFSRLPFEAMPIRRISPALLAEICGGEARELTVLNLSENQITKVEHLECLRNTLERLDLSRNRLETTSGLEVPLPAHILPVPLESARAC